jgi:hypothetical protein
MNDQQAEIERFLLDRPRWVPASEIVVAFGLPDDRPLRATGRHPGPLSLIAISSGEGFKHLRHATPIERIKFKNKLRREEISRYRRRRWFKQGLANCLDYITPKSAAEHHSGQLTFL